MRQLKFHERKLLKKVDFINWELDNNLHELRVLRKYRVKREDYTVYNKLSREIRELARKIKLLPQNDPLRIEATATLLDKLHASGIVPTKKSLELCDKVTASSFCRRRLSSVLVRLRMAENMKTAITFIEHGHVRVGPQVVTDPAMLVTRTLEDFVTWTEESAIRKKVASYNDTRDDFDDA